MGIVNWHYSDCVQMVVNHHCHQFGFHTPFLTWCRWWSNTIVTILVLMHHSKYCIDGGQTPLPLVWLLHTILDGDPTPSTCIWFYDTIHGLCKWWTSTIPLYLVFWYHLQVLEMVSQHHSPCIWCSHTMYFHLVVPHHFSLEYFPYSHAVSWSYTHFIILWWHNTTSILSMLVFWHHPAGREQLLVKVRECF